MVWIKAAFVLGAVMATALCEESSVNGVARILGGVESNFKQQPFVTEVVWFRGRYHLGTATLIAARLAITSAQVTYKLKASDIRVRVNDDRPRPDRRSGEKDSHERDDDSLFEVYKIIEHTCYDPLTQDNDISILKLFEPIRIKVYPLLPTFYEEPAVSTVVAISGWGVRENLLADFSKKLKTVVVQVSNFLDCSVFYRQFTTPRMYCVSTKEGGKDACQGDLGSPVIRVVDNVLEGIIGWGYGCGTNPRVATKISRFVHFIKINSD